MPKILDSVRTKATGPAIVPKTTYLDRWESFTCGMFKGMDWNNVFAAGGAVLACLSSADSTNSYASSDIDLFIYGIFDDETANIKVTIALFVWKRKKSTKSYN